MHDWALCTLMNFCVRFAATAALDSESSMKSSSLRPSTPPAALIFAAVRFAASAMSGPYAPALPVSGSATPIGIGAPCACARLRYGNASGAPSAAADFSILRRVMRLMVPSSLAVAHCCSDQIDLQSVLAQEPLRAKDQQQDQADADDDDADRRQPVRIEPRDHVLEEARAFEQHHHGRGAEDRAGVRPASSRDDRHERVGDDDVAELRRVDVLVVERMQRAREPDER